MSRFDDKTVAQARAMIALYPKARSALIPLCHLAQSVDGWLAPDAMEDIAELLGVTPAEVRGTASFYDMLHTEPTGRYVVAVCTNIACMLAGAYELLEDIEHRLEIRSGQSTEDGLFALEEAECLAACNIAPCVQVNHRFFGPLNAQSFDQLVEDLLSGALEDTVPHHGVLSRVERRVGLLAEHSSGADDGDDHDH